MIFDKALAYYNARTARIIAKRDPQAAAERLRKAQVLQPGNGRYALRALDALVKVGRLEEARRVCASQIRQGDPLQYWRHFDSYVAELQELPAEQASNRPRVVLFNDTDRRPNIGCRLTSQSLKAAVRDALPGCSIASPGFRFAALRENAEPTAGDLIQRLSTLTRRAYGAEAKTLIDNADLVLLQPEGSLDDNFDFDTLLMFFAPVLLALAKGKPAAILNGTVPAYDEKLIRFLTELFALVGNVASRDMHSADLYAVRFIPDAGLAFRASLPATPRDSCLITTGARNSAEQDRNICEMALQICEQHKLRPVVITRASRHLEPFKDRIAAAGGVFAETAGLAYAAQTLARCRLHIGGRYHMAILSLVCGVPTLLFDVKTHKNQWLSEYSPLIRLVGPDTLLAPLAPEMMAMAGANPPPPEPLNETYVEFLCGAVNTEPAAGLDPVRQLISKHGSLG